MKGAQARGKAEGKSSERAPLQFTAPVEDYLKAIYDLERAGKAVGTTAIAEALGVAPASATGMIRRLADQKLITYERYHGARLTARGRAAALRTLRRHRVIEAYLVHALGYGWDEVHEEAERLEHSASDTLIDRMAATMGEPSVDPHGAPIPSRDGALEERSYSTLADVKVGTVVEIMQVADEDPTLLRHLDELTLRPGRTVRVVEHAPFGGPITLRIGRQLRFIGPALAARLLVRERGG
jgi:DtxR family Mn-dependent transcriptional regulator